MSDGKKLTVAAEIRAPVDLVWNAYVDPRDITGWNFASDDWHCPRAENDLRIGGRFSSRMESRDGKAGFDFAGEYLDIAPHERIDYVIADGRKVTVSFAARGDSTRVEVTFEAENVYPPEKQREGWQAILNNFGKYAEGKRAADRGEPG